MLFARLPARELRVLREMLNIPPPTLLKRLSAEKALLMLPMLDSLGAMLGVRPLLAR